MPAITKITCTKADALNPKKIMPQITMSKPAMMYSEFFMTILFIQGNKFFNIFYEKTQKK